MRIVVQRVSAASVNVGAEQVASIGMGLLLLVGVGSGDSREEAEKMVKKVSALRVFPDAGGKMNLSALKVGAEVLVVSQFTLYGNTKKGNRPSFVEAALPEEAEPLLDHLADGLQAEGLNVQKGSFGAHMQVSLVNDGPVTVILDTSR